MNTKELEMVLKEIVEQIGWPNFLIILSTVCVATSDQRTDEEDIDCSLAWQNNAARVNHYRLSLN